MIYAQLLMHIKMNPILTLVKCRAAFERSFSSWSFAFIIFYNYQSDNRDLAIIQFYINVVIKARNVRYKLRDCESFGYCFHKHCYIE